MDFAGAAGFFVLVDLAASADFVASVDFIASADFVGSAGIG